MICIYLRNRLLYKGYMNILNTIHYATNRNYSKVLTSHEIRQKFLDYFIKENNHSFVRSSPVMPYCDPTVAFVNAGMNQFKSIFLGQQTPMYKRVANSQKCVRVGGKHNDISVVGADGYHHTFFEMLGNWSFNDYFKKEACEMSWKLLTEIYGLKPSSLYVTYFAGDPMLNLEPDLECKEIWRSIGIADDHILPFGSSENFWEMGSTGPCGPCTEIHIDHTNSKNRSQDVNKGLPNLTELWNIVFIQYNRNMDGTISSLPQHHIDTGLGLERLTAILQGKSSNYDTDLFTDLFQSIQKKCKTLPKYNGTFGENDTNGIDTAYRILADHSRMITACLADGMIPEENQKLRRILRKALYVSETVFKTEKGLLNELSKVVSEKLGDVFPEIRKNFDQVQQIITYEEEVYKSIRSTATKNWSNIVSKEPKLQNLNILEMPGLVSAYNELISSNTSSISSTLAFKLYDTFGLDEYTIKTLANALKIDFNTDLLKQELENAKLRTKRGFLLNHNLENITKTLQNQSIQKTDDKYKYNYYKTNENNYEFPQLNINILSIIKNETICHEIEPNTYCYLILNRTNFYSESGGQISDVGIIQFPTGRIFEISDTLNMNGYILHGGILKSGENLRINDSGILSIDEAIRLNTMRNHTATHLLNAGLKQVVNGVTCQKSSKVTSEWFSFDVGIYSRKLSVDDIEKIEDLLRNVIRNRTQVKIKEINSQELLNLDNVTMVPGEIYPDTGIRLIEIENQDIFSREPCCGTHVLNTNDIQELCIVNFRSLGRSTTSLTVVTGDRAIAAHKNGIEMLNEVQNLQNELNNSTKDLDTKINQIKQKLNFSQNNDFIISVSMKTKCMNVLNQISKELKDTERDTLKQFIDLEMASVVETNKNKSKNNHPYIVHFLNCSSILDNVPLQRATKVCANIPVIVVSYSDDTVKARCCVPQSLITTDFNAELWLKHSIGKIFRSSSAPPKGQDGMLVCNMKAKKITKSEWDNNLKIALSAAEKYAESYL